MKISSSSASASSSNSVIEGANLKKFCMVSIDAEFCNVEQWTFDPSLKLSFVTFSLDGIRVTEAESRDFAVINFTDQI